VFEVDEAFSTQRAREVMNQMMKKGRRQQKGTKDVVAAAVILRDVLEELR
jgi:RNase H-fold protein (predicted Holliday junction resolvase)